MDYLKELKNVINSVNITDVEAIAEQIYNAHIRNNAVYVFGNGDSATNAFHFVADLAKTAIMHNKKLKIFCLNENVPLITAWANDESYEVIFKRQLENFLEKEDIVIGISTSGNSPNVVAALTHGRGAGATCIALTAFEGGKIRTLVNYCLIAETKNVEIAEDVHFIVGHMIKYYLIKKWSQK